MRALASFFTLLNLVAGTVCAYEMIEMPTAPQRWCALGLLVLFGVNAACISKGADSQ